MSAILEFLFAVAMFLVVVAPIILIHEMGHYWVGRFFRFGIEAFSLGFGPKIWERQGRVNAWQARWILVGGFVKFHGEMDNPECEVPEGVDPKALFPRKPRWQRFLVLLAGVGANVLSAYLLFAGLAYYGIEESLRKDQPATVGQVAPDSPAQKAGVLPGDKILSVDGHAVKNWEEAEREIYTLMRGGYPLVVERGGKQLTLHLDPETVEVLKQPMGVIGVFSTLPPVIGRVATPSSASEAGLKPGDVVRAVDGRPIQYWDELPASLAGNTGQPVILTVGRGGETLSVTLTPRFDEARKRYMIGVEYREYSTVRYPFPACFVKAAQLSLDQSTLAYRTFAKLIQRKMPVNALSGPPTLVYISGEVAKTGLYNLLFLMGVISIQIAIFNLLPIPALDGGHIFVLAIEGALRRDLPLMVKEWIMRIGFGALILLFAVVILMDLFKFM